MIDHKHTWEKSIINGGGCQCTQCHEEPEFELTCGDLNCLEVLDPATPGYDKIVESADWF